MASAHAVVCYLPVMTLPRFDLDAICYLIRFDLDLAPRAPGLHAEGERHARLDHARRRLHLRRSIVIYRERERYTYVCIIFIYIYRERESIIYTYIYIYIERENSVCIG